MPSSPQKFTIIINELIFHRRITSFFSQFYNAMQLLLQVQKIMNVTIGYPQLRCLNENVYVGAELKSFNHLIISCTSKLKIF
jgi:hypothetical protein